MLVALFWLLTAAAGAALADLVRVPLRLEERAAIALILGVVAGTMAGFFTAVATSMSVGAMLAAPLLVLAIAAAVDAAVVGDVGRPWRDSVADARARWETREIWPMLVLLLLSIAGFVTLFHHTFITGADGSISTAFPTVWADWSLHSITANNFALGHNLPPTDPVFAGAPLHYPFMPDYQSGMLVTLGSTLADALAVPGAVLCVAITVLLVSLAQRLTRSFIAGVVAVAVCLLGGSLGFSGVYWDACARHQTGAVAGGISGLPADLRAQVDSDCAPSRIVRDPVGGVRTLLGTLHEMPDVIAAQPRAYDGLETDSSVMAAGNLQWYTPMLAWWLPQRTFLYGFAITLAVLLLLRAALEQREARAWSAFAAAGLLAGTLPLFHVHSLIALAIALPVLALLHRRREWLLFLGLAAAVALPRLLQLATGDHGAADGPLGPNVYPWLEPGWKWVGDPLDVRHFDLTASGVVHALVTAVRVALTPGFWGFWLLNAGVLIPLCLVLAVAAAVTRVPWERVRAGAQRVASVVPAETLRFCLPFMLVFVAANIVVFQSWDWDNTKLLVYWQLAAGLLLGAWAARWLRGGVLRALVAGATVLTVLATGLLAMARMLPWTPPAERIPWFTWASPDDRALADAVAARTAPNAVVLSSGLTAPDPLLTLAGRRGVMGYEGWLWSYGYGEELGRRYRDIRTIYRGCTDVASTNCDALRLLHHYGVSLIEVGPAELSQSAQESGLVPNTAWLQQFPVLARDDQIVVYDVRGS